MDVTEHRPFEFSSRTHFAVTYEINLDLKVTERTVYSFLDWIGDIGGLYDGIRLFFLGLILSLKYNKLEAYLVEHLYRFDENNPLAGAEKLKKKSRA